MVARLSAEHLRDIGLLLMRGMLGAVFVYHGGQKLFGWWEGPGLGVFASYLQQLSIPLPAYAAVLAGSAEFVGGLALISGCWIRVAIIPAIFTMAVAIYFVHPTSFAVQNNGMEYPLTLAVLLGGLSLTGPGRFALRTIPIERWLARQRTVHTLTSNHATDVSTSV